jgi:hypothetical protein
MANLVIFKSSDLYFGVEQIGLKNNTVQKIKAGDPRDKVLWEWAKAKNYGTIRIESSWGEHFERQVKHVCKWDDLWIITWRS